jgi:hypothetical protein
VGEVLPEERYTVVRAVRVVRVVWAVRVVRVVWAVRVPCPPRIR